MAKAKGVTQIKGSASYPICLADEPGRCPPGAIKIRRATATARPGFRYTTPSTIPKRTPAERRGYMCRPGQTPGVDCGCEEKPGKKGQFTGRVHPVEAGIKDSFCKKDDPCGSARVACPVQAIWINGRPFLRFCNELKKPGWIIPAPSVKEAQKIARKACAKWPHKPKVKVEWPPKFFEKNAPEMVKMARKAVPDSPWKAPGLGQAPTRAAVPPIVPIGSVLALLISILSQ
jgi:hypothetical protein